MVESSEYVKLLKLDKGPVAGPWQTTTEPSEFLRDGFNVGLRLRRLTAVDIDAGKEFARKFYMDHKEIISTIIETYRGCHFLFSGETKQRALMINGKKFGDIKSGENSYLVSPPSVVRQIDGTCWKYRQVQAGILQSVSHIDTLFPIERKEISKSLTIDESDPVRRVIRARAWVMKREKKEDGNGRGLQTIKTCRALFTYFGLSEDQVWPLILEYNERCCIPPYSEKQLRHKIKDSQK